MESFGIYAAKEKYDNVVTVAMTEKIFAKIDVAIEKLRPGGFLIIPFFI